ncbi:MAG: hypothetical protein KBT00_03170 [Bacteroidales bacterium]|nr:hypothetical protein [Candidatus Cacconaster merdequi]
MKRILIVCALLASAMSCTVKESRLGCPCILNLDYSNIRQDERVTTGGYPDSLLVTVQGLYNAFVHTVDYPQYHQISIPRRRSHLNCYFGITASRLCGDRTRLEIPLGEDSDRFFSYHQTLELDEFTEELYITPVLRNECTTVILAFDEESWDTSSSETKMTVYGTSCGLDLNTGYAIEGPFIHDMGIYDGHSYCFNMPRQAKRDIRIDAIEGEGDVLFSVDLAGELDRAGYNWSAESLPPAVFVNINAQHIVVDIKIIDWDEAVYFNYYL